MSPAAKRILLSLPAACLLWGQVFASQLPADSFRVEAPATAAQGADVPVRVTALDVDGDVVDDYIGTVYIVAKGDAAAKMPANRDHGYTFLPGERGTHLFATGVVFGTDGAKELSVIDLDDESLGGTATVTILKDACADAASKVSLSAPKSVSSPSVSVAVSAPANCGVSLFLNGRPAGSATTGSGGSATAALSGLSAGNNLVEAKLSGGASASATVNYSADSLTVTSPKSGGNVGGSGTTVTGSTGSGKTVTVSVGGKVVGTGKSGSDGNFSIPVSGLPSGNFTLTVRNDSGASATVDASLDASVRITSPKSGDAPGAGGATRVTGSTAPSVAVTATSGKSSVTGSSDASGNFSLDLSGVLPGATVTAKNSLGGSASVRLGGEDSVRISSPKSGDSAGSSATVTGSATAGAALTASVGGKSVGTGAADASGNFSFAVTGLPSGKFTLSVRSDSGASDSVTLNSGAAKSAGLSISSPKSGDAVGSSTTVTGTASANAALTALAGWKTVGSGKSDASGNFSFPVSGLPSGAFVLTVREVSSGDSDSVRLSSGSSGSGALSHSGTPAVSILRGSLSDGTAALDFSVSPDSPDVRNFRLLAGASCQSLTGAAVSEDKSRLYGPDWKNYRWSFSASGASAFAVGALGADGEPLGDVSACMELSDGSCEIGAISGVRSSADPKALKSVLSWDAHPDADGYSVYRVGADGEPAFVAKVAGTSYAVNMAPGKTKFEDFVVRGVCKPGAKASADLGNATRVQTGPETALLLLAALLFAAALAVRKFGRRV